MTLLRIEKQPLPPAERREELRDGAMVPVSCCDWLEAALAAQLVEVAQSAPAFYLRRGAQHWAIRHCPGCGESLAHEEHPARLPDYTIDASGARICGGCRQPGHYRRTCPGGTK